MMVEIMDLMKAMNAADEMENPDWVGRKEIGKVAW